MNENRAAINNTHRNSKTKAVLLGLLVLIVLLGASSTVYYSQHHKVTDQSSQISYLRSQIKDPYAGWNTYCDNVAKACIKYPSTWQQVNDFPGAYLNPNGPGYVALVGPTVKDGAAEEASIVSVKDLSPQITDLKIVGFIVNNKPAYMVYNSSYVASVGLVEGATVNLFDGNYRFSGKYSDTGLVATPGANGYSSITNASQANAWFNGAEAQTCLKILRSFYYQ